MKSSRDIFTFNFTLERTVKRKYQDEYRFRSLSSKRRATKVNGSKMFTSPYGHIAEAIQKRMLFGNFFHISSIFLGKTTSIAEKEGQRGHCFGFLKGSQAILKSLPWHRCKAPWSVVASQIKHPEHQLYYTPLPSLDATSRRVLPARIRRTLLIRCAAICMRVVSGAHIPTPPLSYQKNRFQARQC